MSVCCLFGEEIYGKGSSDSSQAVPAVSPT